MQYLHDLNAKVYKVFGEVYLVMHKDELYQKTTEGLSLRCLGFDQARMAMGGVYEL